VSVTKHSVEEAPDLGSLPAAKDAVWKYGYEQNTATNKSLSHLLKTVQTPNHTETESHITTYEYDQAKVDLPIIKITFPESVTNAFGYTKEGDLRRRTKVKDGNGKETEYIFDSRPQDSLEPSETTINAPLGATTVIRWNNYGQKKKETDPEGRTTEFWYDDRQNPTITETKDAGGTTLYFTSTHYDQKFNKPDQVSVKRSAAETLTTTYTIDQNTGNVRRIALPNGGIIEMDYYANGDLMWQKDQFGTRTDFSNYEYGFPKTVKVNNGTSVIQSNREYDGRTRLTDSSGNLEPTVKNVYDTFDRIVNQTITDPSGYRDELTATITYKPEGQVSSVKRLGSGLTYNAANIYDNLNRLRFVTETGTNINYSQEFTYDNNSNLKTHRNRRNAITSRDYNELNFVVTEKVGELVVMNVPDPTNNIDRLGNVKKYTDLFGKTITQEFDGANRITKRIYSDCRDNSAACEETFEYDGSDNVIRKTDKNGKATIVAYDKLNRPFDVTNPLGYVTEYRYNDAARTVTVTDAVRGLTRTIVQDALNRPTEENIQFGSTVYSTKYEYDGLTTTITDPRGTTTTRKLSTFGDVGESKTAPRGSETLDQTHLVQTRYYASGAPKQMIDALGRKTDYQIDGLNRVRGATYPKPAHLTGSVTESWAYDGEGLLTAHTDKRGVQTETSYDLLGRRDTVKVNNNGLVTVLDVDYLDAQAKETRKDANNHTTTLVYDGLHRVKQLTNADGKIKNFVYDGENLRQESDFKAEPKFTRYEYDALDRVEKVYDRAGKLTQVVYADGSTSTKTVTDRRGNKVIETYDALGRLTQVESGGMLLAKYEYDAGNNRTAEVDGESNRSEFVFNNLNRLVTAKRGASGGGFLQTESYAYDANGNLKVYSDGRGGSVSQSFDELDHLLDRKDGENNKTSYKHDGEGLLTEIIEPCGNGGASCDAGAYKTVYGYNAFGSIKNITDAKGGAWAFDYYADGKLLKEATDATGLAARKVSYVYDNLDRLKTVKQPLVPASVYDYDENSNVISVTDPKGQIQQIVPDALDRVETHSYKSAGGAELLRYKYTYDSEDNVKQIDETLSIGSAAQTFTDKRDYDQRNRLIWAVDKFGHRVEFGYDKSDNIASITDKKSESSPTASTTAYIYDALNRVKTVTLPNAETVSYAWHSDGLLERANYASGMKREYGYDNADRVTSIKNTVNAAEVQEFIYGYDGNSNRKSETKKLNGTTYRTFGYKYDELNRLSEAKDTTPAPATQPAPNQQVTVNETSAIKTFEYDSVGNREKEHTKSQSTPVTRTANSQGEVTESRGTPGEETLIGTAAASFDQLNRLIKLTEADGTIKDLSYDSNGNLLETKQNGVVQQIFEYDPRNQLRKVLSAANTEIVRFDYDVERRRVEKTVNNGSATKPERYVYAADKVIAEYKGATQYETEQARFQIGAAETVRGEFFNPLGNQQSEGARYYFSDALGSTTALAGQVGNDWKATSRYDYDSWGVQSNTNNSNNTIGYTGQRLDSETGLMALGNGERYYSPTLARFIQQDSFSGSLNLPQSLNRFSYSYNNPLKFVDPSGNAPAYIEADRKFLNRERQQASEWFNNQRENSGFLGRVGITLLETGYGAMRSFTEGSKELIFTIGDLGTKPIYDALGTPQGDRVYSSQLIEAERQDILDGTNQASARGKTIGKALLSPLTIPYNAFYENPRALNSGEISLSEYNMRQGGLLFDAVMLYVGAKAGGAKATVATESRVGLGTRLQNLKSGLSEGWQATKNFARNLKSEATAEWNRFLTEERGSIILREGKPQPKARFIVGEEGRTVDLQSVANPNEINFTQRTVSGNVENYVQDMKAGNWDWTKSSPIRVMEVNGRLVSYDNRRLMAARLAGLKEIPIIKIDPQSIMPGSKSSWASKFKSRRLDQRNIEAGGIVPEEGLSELPKVVTGK
jgi:RHS repeat-associated protein